MARASSVVFLLLAGLTVLFAVDVGGWAWGLLWPAASLFGVAIAYAGARPGVFGKRPDGSMRLVNVVLLLPFLGLTWMVWGAHRRLTGEACWHEIVPQLFLGRRALAGELPAEVELIVDLTAEFPAPRIVRSAVGYRCLPTLDTSVPDLDRLGKLVAEVAAFPGRVYVHCALGHGRSALFVAAVLLVRGVAADPKTAVAMVRAARTSIRLNRVQLSSLRLLAANWGTPPAATEIR